MIHIRLARNEVMLSVLKYSVMKIVRSKCLSLHHRLNLVIRLSSSPRS